jgi:hypothetical protein
LERNKDKSAITISRQSKDFLRIYSYLTISYFCDMSKMSGPNERPPQLNIKVSAEEKELAEKVAKARGLKTSGLVRMLILDEARRLGIL